MYFFLMGCFCACALFLAHAGEVSQLDTPFVIKRERQIIAVPLPSVLIAIIKNYLQDYQEIVSFSLNGYRYSNLTQIIMLNHHLYCINRRLSNEKESFNSKYVHALQFELDIFPTSSAKLETSQGARILLGLYRGGIRMVDPIKEEIIGSLLPDHKFAIEAMVALDEDTIVFSDSGPERGIKTVSTDPQNQNIALVARTSNIVFSLIKLADNRSVISLESDRFSRWKISSQLPWSLCCSESSNNFQFAQYSGHAVKEYAGKITLGIYDLSSFRSGGIFKEWGLFDIYTGKLIRDVSSLRTDGDYVTSCPNEFGQESGLVQLSAGKDQSSTQLVIYDFSLPYELVQK